MGSARTRKEADLFDAPQVEMHLRPSLDRGRYLPPTCAQLASDIQTYSR